ncbi:anaerobic ribonucleoside-triphosphate reductase activating protein [Campylobacter pinnipediorum]|uniref:anaerobic ribonucleoside-triphosphate reductase activating protein n=1 Tax=Campylobacter pinnipediorum TaxID=1965231 RepID=UPI0009954D09|nr:anaerobic ribonucleoside-triphosphate reductase activating protein [Campylobacter pinnipediorum]AQW82084.1 anaerobic ribonucleoside triphosphate reductase activating protein [Campylobacter pinnipediorum subsp. pinnipediorum]
MGIFKITPFNLTDYAGKIACVVWFCGCNMRCQYCYNTEIVLGEPYISDEDFCKFLDSRKNKLDAVVFSGGECTLAKSFLKLAKEVKKRGFLLKIDTNGTNLKILKEAIQLGLIDYIALDFKSLKEKFKDITNSNLYDEFMKTLKYLISINFDFEVRTTVHNSLLNSDDIHSMYKLLKEEGYNNEYFLQNFLDTGENFGNLKA